jgi:glycosyltransferase involved in cell wall biosynthesis
MPEKGLLEGKRISVVITSYNQKGYLKEAVESVLGQTLKPFEILLCDDASSDGSQKLIRHYEQQHPGVVKGVLHERNLGISRNRSSGFERVSGDYKGRAMEGDPEVKWVYSQVDLIDAEGKKFGTRYVNPPEGYIIDEVVTMLGMAPRNPLVECEALKKAGFFRHDMTLYEDYDLCLRLSKNYKVAYCPQSLMEYRVHQGGVHKSPREEHLRNLRKLYKNFRKLVSDYPRDRRTMLENRLMESIKKVAGEDVNIKGDNIINSLLGLLRKLAMLHS